MIPLSDEEQHGKEVTDRKSEYTKSLEDALGKQYILAKDSLIADDKDTPEAGTYTTDPLEPTQDGEREEEKVQHEAGDPYIAARAHIPQGDTKEFGVVVRRKKDANGNLIGVSNSNPLLDTSIYEVEFDSGEAQAYNTNIIAESIFSQVDSDGYTTFTLKEIVNH